MEKIEDLCAELTNLTQEILDAATADDLDALGRAIETRQKALDRLVPFQSAVLTDEEKRQFDALRALDKKAGLAMKRLFERYKRDVKASRVKYDGLVKYFNNRYDLSSGRVMDEIR